MDEPLQIAIELNEYTWNGFKKDLEDVTTEEVNWRPVPEANTINLIVRHLRIDTPWHVRNVGNNDRSQDADATSQTADPAPLRNLYCKTRGEPARFFPDNPSFPQ